MYKTTWTVTRLEKSQIRERCSFDITKDALSRLVETIPFIQLRLVGDTELTVSTYMRKTSNKSLCQLFEI